MTPITHDFIRENFGLYLIKFAEKEEYVDELLDGRIYMKASGYFRKLEDGYRGDKFDGKKPVDVTGMVMSIEAEDGTKLVFNNSPDNKVWDFYIGFSGDDKVPIFCAVLMNDRIIEITGDNTFKIKDEYLQEMQQFGNYVAFIPLGEMLQKIEEYSRQHSEPVIYGPVEYSDIMQTYKFDDPEDENIGVYRRFFRKDIAYRFQNEWRMVLASDKELIGKEEDHLIIDFGRFKYGFKVDMDMLMNGRFQIEEI